MRSSRMSSGIAFVAAAAVVFFGLIAVPRGADAVEPIVLEGTPRCVDTLGYDSGYKLEPVPPQSGTYTFPDGVNTVTIVTDGTYCDFTTSLPVDAVIVKGGPAGNVYFFDVGTFGESDLHAPTNPSGGFAGISYVEFCYGDTVESLIFADDFECGSCARWSSRMPAQ